MLLCLGLLPMLGYSQNNTLSVISTNPPSLAGQDDAVTLNFINSNLEDVIKGVSALTGVRFLLSNNIKNKTVSLVTKQPIHPSQVYGTLLSMLRTFRLVAVNNGGVVNIVPETEAWPQVKPQTARSPDSQLVSKVVKFKNITAALAANIIRPLLSQKGFPLVANNNNNTLVVVDYASNLRNLETILYSLDQPNQLLPVVFPVKHLSVLDAESSLNSMLQSPPVGSAKGAQLPVSENIFADVPNNRLLIRAHANRLAYIAQLLAFIDVPRKSTNLINVYPLKYTNAEEMAKKLETLLAKTGSSSQAASSPTTATTATNATGTSNQLAGAVLDLSGGINIQADNATNSLIIAAPENLYRNIIDIVRKLDVRRRQIFVEMLIVDISGDRVNELGVQWLAAEGINSNGRSSLIGGTNLDSPTIASVAQNPLATGSGLTLGIVKGTINLPGVGEILNLGVLARALETKFSANVLSAPNLLVLNNEEAKLLVGTNVPVVTGQFTQTSNATDSPFQTIERLDIGVNLRIKPQIMDSGTILLDFYQEVSDILSITAQGPTTSKRSIESKLLLDDGQIMVLGGLISERQTDTLSSVPVLGQIPLLGRLFSYTEKRRSKSNLLIFIRPVILKTEDDATSLAERKYQAMFNQMPYKGEDLGGIFSTDAPILPILPSRVNNALLTPKLKVLQINEKNASEPLLIPDGIERLLEKKRLFNSRLPVKNNSGLTSLDALERLLEEDTRQ